MAPQTAVSTAALTHPLLAKVGPQRMSAFLPAGPGLPGLDTCADASVAGVLRRSGSRVGTELKEFQERMVMVLQGHGSVIQLEKEKKTPKKTETRPIAAEIHVKFSFAIRQSRSQDTLADSRKRIQRTDQLVVPMPLSGSLCGSAHAPVGPDRSISRVHCCKC